MAGMTLSSFQSLHRISSLTVELKCRQSDSARFQLGTFLITNQNWPIRLCVLLYSKVANIYLSHRGHESDPPSVRLSPHRRRMDL